MKKTLIVSAILTLAFSAKIFAQDGEPAYAQGASSVSVGYGFVSPFKTLFKLSNAFGASSGVTAKFSSLGPIGLTYEYGVSEKISVGMQVAYGTLKNIQTEKDGLGAGKDYIVTQKMDQISAIIRGNYHLGSSDKFDPYIGLGLGYGNFKFKSTSNDPNDTPSDLAYYNISVPGALGITGQVGAKYYFSSNFGAYAELGYLAGSFAQLGLTVKF
jgi:outer membrane protein W